MSHCTSLSDAELMDLVAAGNREAFAELFGRYWKKMLAIAFNKIRDIDEAEEIVQEIFVSLWSRRETLLAVTSVNNYLASCVKYQVIKVLAKENTRRKYIDQQLLAVSEPSLETPDWLGFSELQERLGKLVADLPETSRLVYHLSQEEGYSQRQIAEKLNITEKAVENRLRRALKTIRTGLSHLLLLFL